VRRPILSRKAASVRLPLTRRQFLAGSAGASVLLSMPPHLAALPSTHADGPGAAGLWDYRARPIKVWQPGQEQGGSVEAAFDGFGGVREPDALGACWIDRRPLDDTFICIMDYGVATTVSKFIHSFYVPEKPDFRPNPLLLGTGFSTVRISTSDDGSAWKILDTPTNIPLYSPQPIGISAPRAARYYRLEIPASVQGLSGIRTYEIDTLLGPVIHTPVSNQEALAGAPCVISGTLVGAANPRDFTVNIQHAPAPVQTSGGQVNASGAWRLVVTFRDVGIFPVVLVLTDRSGAQFDIARCVLSINPAVLLADVRERAERLRGRAINQTDYARTVLLASATGSRRRLVLASREQRFFELPVGRGPGPIEVRVQSREITATRWRFPRDLEASSSRGTMSAGNSLVGWRIDQTGLHLDIGSERLDRPLQARLTFDLDGNALALQGVSVDAKSAQFRALRQDGWIEVALECASASRIQVRLAYCAAGLASHAPPAIVTVRMSCESVKFRFLPAYVYSERPIVTMQGILSPICFPGTYEDAQQLSTVQQGALLPTRMVALGLPAGTLALVPEHERCLVGIDGDEAVVRERLTERGVLIDLYATGGDWFEVYRAVVTERFQFAAAPAHRSISACLEAQGYYLAHNPDIWSRELKVITSFQKIDFVFVFYGLTYSIPALLLWHRATGDTAAAERARACVDWLTGFPDIRVREGHARGAYFSQYLSPRAVPHPFGHDTYGGCDQAWNRWLTTHATGAVIWTLLQAYALDESCTAVLATLSSSVEWLLRTQSPDGGWPYAHQVDGTAVSTEQGSGNIWSIWALFRYGKLTGDERCNQAAERAKAWFVRTFLDRHIGRGYWEDVSGNGGQVKLSWGAYELGIAALVFHEMQDDENCVAAARLAITWIWTRTPPYRQ
jgi:hypothetical protein